MDSITIPDVDETLRRRLEARATLHRKSIEAEARDVLREALGCHAPEPQLEDSLRRYPKHSRTDGQRGDGNPIEGDGLQTANGRVSRQILPLRRDLLPRGAG